MALVLSSLTLLSACGQDTEAVESSPAAAESPEFRSAYMEAACACERLVLGTNTFWASDVARLEDPDLQAYVDARDSFPNPSGGYCASLTQSPHGSALATMATHPSVACSSSLDVSIYDRTDRPLLSGFLTAGSCRAEVNYCLGMELALAANSTTAPPSTATLRARLLTEARARMSASAIENTSTFEWLYQACIVEPGTAPVPLTWWGAKFENACRAFRGANAGETSLSAHMSRRILDGVDSITRWTVDAIDLQSTLADSIPPPAALGSASEWNRLQWGPDSPRMVAAKVLYGDGSPMTRIYSRRDTGAYDRSDASNRYEWDWEIPTSRPLTAFGHRAAELLEQARVPSGALVDENWNAVPFDYSDWVASPASGESGASVSGAIAIHRYLDHRLAAMRRTGPYRAPVAPYDLRGELFRSDEPVDYATLWWAIAHPISAADSPLVREHVTSAHVAEALAARADVFATMAPSMVGAEVDTVSIPVPFGAETPVLNGREILGSLAYGRSLLPLVNALGRAGANDREVDLTIGHGRPVPTSNGGRSSPWNYYELAFHRRADTDPYVGDPTATHTPYSYTIDERGVSGALHLVRVHLREAMNRIGTSVPASVSVAADVLPLAIEGIERAIGTYWTDYNPLNQKFRIAYPIPTSGTIDPFAGTAILVSPHLDDAECVERALADGNPLYCSTGNADYLDTPVVTDDASSGVRYRTFTLDSARDLPVPDNTRGNRPLLHVQLVRWRPDSSDPAQLVLASGTHIDTLDGYGTSGWGTPAVHSTGGDLGMRIIRLFERQPGNPSMPALNSLGLSPDLVPPLESALDANGDGTEQSMSIYLAESRKHTASAKQLMADARAAEIAAVQQDRANAASIALAAQVMSGEVAELCGGDASRPTPCAVPRRPVTTPAELGFGVTMPTDLTSLEGDFPATWPSDPVERALVVEHCDSVVRTLGANLPSLDSNVETLKGHVLEAITCMHVLVFDETQRLELTEFPEAVIAELQAGGIGTYRGSTGAVRDLHIQLHEAIEGARQSAKDFEAARSSALGTIQSRSSYIGSLSDAAQRSRMACILGAVATTIEIGVKIAQASVQIHDNASKHATSAANRTSVEGVNAALSNAYAQNSMCGPLEKLPPVYSSTALNVQLGAGIAGDVGDLTALIGTNCQVDQTQIRNLELGLAISVFQSMTAMSTHRATLLSVIATASQGVNAYDLVEYQADEARARYVRSVALTQSDSLADLPAFRASQSVTTEHARASFRRAQQGAFIARRAVGAALAEDLDRMVAREPFVDPPAGWVNAIYSMAYRTTGNPPVIAASEGLADWTTQLDNFVAGYGVSRRFRDGTDVAILDLDAIDDRSGDARPFYSMLIYQCSGHPRPLLAGSIDGLPTQTPCAGLGDVVSARYDFTISTDRSTYTGDQLASGSFNYRQDGIAFNLVGNSIVDCNRALRPAECALDGNLQYTLRQSDLTFVENYAGDTLAFFYGAGVVLDARSLAASRALGNPISAGDRTLLTPYMRYEMRGRPLRGSYSLVIEGRPEIVWSEILTIQAAVSYDYWTRQQ